MKSQRQSASTRVSILGWVIIPLAIAMTIGFAATNALLLQKTYAEIDEQLVQEAVELKVLAERAVSPLTADRYSSAKELLSLYISRTVPAPDEAVFIVVNNVVTERSSGDLHYRLDQDKNFISTITRNREPNLTTYESEFGQVRYIAIPVAGDGDSGYMVAGIFTALRNSPDQLLLLQLGALFFFAIIISVWIGWVVSGRILKPIKNLQNAIETINDGNFHERIRVSSPNSELGRIAQKFNEMLETIKVSFEAQRRFVDDAGHELKTPLTIISGHLDMIDTANSESQSSLVIARDEAKRMARLVRDLQTLTKSNEPRFIEMSVNSVSETIDEVFVKANGLGDRDWKFFSESEQAIVFDRQRIVQAMLQLVENAIKHTEPSDSIEVGFRGHGKFVDFYVGDSGPGIPTVSRSQITERFKRGEWTSQDVEGSGLGLAIVDAVCKGHKGLLLIQDSELGGAEVIIRIPATKINEDK